MTPEELALLGIDATQILLVWSWGFGSVILFHFMGYCLGTALKMIRML
ncbi:MAG: hypothetical protein ACD_10C00303G0003 [uncultured bacterium]|nr:MAG: hypothetical protein ACD_10C00303G0003 [uncultured bacterium]